MARRSSMPTSGWPLRRWLCAIAAMVGIVLLVSSRKKQRRETIIIVGGGMAGLSAARALQHAHNVMVMEAQQQVGGRVRTDRSLGVAIELGAVWIHRATHNVVASLADQFSCPRFVTENRRLALYADGTRVLDSEVQAAYANLTLQIMPAVLRRRAKVKSDRTMKALITHVLSRLHIAPGTRRRRVIEFLLYRHIVQDHAAGLERTSAREYDTDYYGGAGHDELLPQGYDCIARGLAKGIDVRRGMVATAIYWNDDWVEVMPESGRVLIADRVIVTVPLGVLQLASTSYEPPTAVPAWLKAGSGLMNADGGADSAATCRRAGCAGSTRGALRFQPSLPPPMRKAVRALGYGEAHSLALRFPFAFWPTDAHFIGIMSDSAGTCCPLEFLNVQRYHEDATPVLLLLSSASTARFLANMSDVECMHWAVGRLRAMFGNVPTPTKWLVSRPDSNPFQRGAWSYAPVGVDSATLRQRMRETSLAGGRLLLAGEHTSELHPGTVHGAVVSGRHAAHRMLAAAAGKANSDLGYLNGYLDKLLAAIGGGGDGDDDDVDEFAWDRNP